MPGVPSPRDSMGHAIYAAPLTPKTTPTDRQSYDSPMECLGYELGASAHPLNPNRRFGAVTRPAPRRPEFRSFSERHMERGPVSFLGRPLDSTKQGGSTSM